MKGLLTFFVVLGGIAWAGPYAPEVGQTDTTAISKDSSSFVGWATGYQDVTIGPNATDSGYTADDTLGPAEGTAFDVLPLGDGGSIVLTFAAPITNGAGFDFAVFENAVDSAGDQAFLELAFVEVSSNGSDFFRFESDSQTADPVGAFDTLDTTNIDGLAGKYTAGYGTPFDLDLLAGTSGLDVNAVTHVRITDVIGDGTTLDSQSDPVYDPDGTTGTSGFDLDAIGVIHAVPEPAALVLLVVAGMLLTHWRRRQ